MLADYLLDLGHTEIGMIAQRVREHNGVDGEGLFELLFHASRGVSAMTDPTDGRSSRDGGTASPVTVKLVGSCPVISM